VSGGIWHIWGDPRRRFEQWDICEELGAQFNPDSVGYAFRLASFATPLEYVRLAIEPLRLGFAGSEIALKIAQRYGAGVPCTSTSEHYDHPLEHPQTEKYVSNENPVGFRSVYDEVDRYAEALAMVNQRSRNINRHVVGVVNSYGPLSRPNDGRVIYNGWTVRLLNSMLRDILPKQTTCSRCGSLKASMAQRNPIRR